VNDLVIKYQRITEICPTESGLYSSEMPCVTKTTERTQQKSQSVTVGSG